MASKGSAAPSKNAPKGSAGPLKTATSKDDSTSSRCSPTKVRVDGVLVDVEGFSHPRRSTPSSRPQVPPKPVASDRRQSRIWFFPISFLPYSMMRWTRHQFFKDKIMVCFIIRRFLRGFSVNFEEINPLAWWYEGAIIEVQETCVVVFCITRLLFLSGHFYADSLFLWLFPKTSQIFVGC